MEATQIKTMPEIFKNPRYQGKHIIVIKGKVFTAKTTTPSESRNRKTSTAIKM